MNFPAQFRGLIALPLIVACHSPNSQVDGIYNQYGDGRYEEFLEIIPQHEAYASGRLLLCFYGKSMETNAKASMAQDDVRERFKGLSLLDRDYDGTPRRPSKVQGAIKLSSAEPSRLTYALSFDRLEQAGKHLAKAESRKVYSHSYDQKEITRKSWLWVPVTLGAAAPFQGWRHFKKGREISEHKGLESTFTSAVDTLNNFFSQIQTRSQLQINKDEVFEVEETKASLVSVLGRMVAHSHKGEELGQARFAGGAFKYPCSSSYANAYEALTQQLLADEIAE